MQAKTREGYVTIAATETFGGIKCLIVNCTDSETYNNLPQVVEYEDVLFGKTGWNSDRNCAYFRSDAKLARKV